MQILNALHGWDDAVGEKVAALAKDAEKRYAEPADRLAALTAVLRKAALDPPVTTTHPVSGFEPPAGAERGRK